MARFFAPLNDTTNAVIDCAGQSNVGGPPGVWYTDMFVVAKVSGTWWLQCQSQTSGVAGPIVNLIPNVTNMTVLYGVAPSAAGDDYSVIQYLNATQVGATNNWPNVTAVKVTLTFLVPSYGSTGGQMSTNTQTFQCVIPVMSRVGGDT